MAISVTRLTNPCCFIERTKVTNTISYPSQIKSAHSSRTEIKFFMIMVIFLLDSQQT